LGRNYQENDALYWQPFCVYNNLKHRPRKDIYVITKIKTLKRIYASFTAIISVKEVDPILNHTTDLNKK